MAKTSKTKADPKTGTPSQDRKLLVREVSLEEILDKGYATQELLTNFVDAVYTASSLEQLMAIKVLMDKKSSADFQAVEKLVDELIDRKQEESVVAKTSDKMEEDVVPEAGPSRGRTLAAISSPGAKKRKADKLQSASSPVKDDEKEPKPRRKLRRGGDRPTASGAMEVDG